MSSSKQKEKLKEAQRQLVPIISHGERGTMSGLGLSSASAMTRDM